MENEQRHELQPLTSMPSIREVLTQDDEDVECDTQPVNTSTVSDTEYEILFDQERVVHYDVNVMSKAQQQVVSALRKRSVSPTPVMSPGGAGQQSLQHHKSPPAAVTSSAAQVFQDEYSPKMMTMSSISNDNESSSSPIYSAASPPIHNINGDTPVSSLGGTGPSKAQSHHQGPAYTPDSKGRNIMSDASRMFDRDGKGYLDSTERALRTLDTDNDGRLTVDNMYALMKNLQEAQQSSNELVMSLHHEQQKSFKLKWGVGALTVFAVLLSVANIGTAFVAARLAKETSISSVTFDMVDKNTGTRIGVTNKNTEFVLQPMTQDKRRQLKEVARRRRNLGEFRDLNEWGNSSDPGDDDDDDDDGDADIQGLLCGNPYMWSSNAGSNRVRECSTDTVIDYTTTVEMYRSICPEWAPNGNAPSACPSQNGGVDQFYLTCNGKTNRIFGTPFPRNGPFIYGNPINTLWPGLNNNGTMGFFYGEQIVVDMEQSPPLCFQAFWMGMICLAEIPGNECFPTALPIEPLCPWYDPGINSERRFSLCDPI
mmetsp:Transcript_12800/g.16774  ORF Transcript_12800/g.16774 Transcript_12800/m.16774 type:complete len:540 (+) Transcript_12800:145-1764(+)|eukprot:CAMPEP_0198142516 /NCGR_PEP_ID=MMETSP1443-20131203/5282_1 /TAXON_ID=186043 /ORGANISM="Entomoneis sp., Strain CCMP2396" /LENGTH=539 /DNA_ID=CAMNT_0043805541 /DNA_START=46 /DNA_END=1665 /DNA_ORIENTATION=-